MSQKNSLGSDIFSMTWEQILLCHVVLQLATSREKNITGWSGCCSWTLLPIMLRTHDCLGTNQTKAEILSSTMVHISLIPVATSLCKSPISPSLQGHFRNMSYTSGAPWTPLGCGKCTPIIQPLPLRLHLV